MKYSILQQNGQRWDTGKPLKEIQTEISTGNISIDWLICPQDEPELAVPIRKFISNPKIFEPSAATAPSDHRMTFPIATTPQLPGRDAETCKGIVCGEVIMGANLFRDVAAELTDIVGGRSKMYESKLRNGRFVALKLMIAEAKERGAHAVVGVTIDYETVGTKGMLMICAKGTAITLKQSQAENS